MNDFFPSLDAINDILASVADPVALLFVIEGFLLFMAAKVIKDFLSPSFELEKELLTQDNPALALSASGYWLGVGIIIEGTLAGSSDHLFIDEAYPILSDSVETILWGLIGILLLNLAAKINDVYILSPFSNVKEIIKDRNTGVGAVVMGTYVAAALIIRPFVYTSSLSGSFYLDVILTGVYFIVAHVELMIFFKLYARFTGYDVLGELEKDNPAAGAGTGLALVAIANVISYSLYINYNLLAFVLYFINGTIILLATHWLIDKFVLSQSKLKDEITRDRNWGAALIQGVLMLAMSLILTAAFSLQ